MFETTELIKNGSSADPDKPVSRQHEIDDYRYHGYPNSWGYPKLRDMEGSPTMLAVNGLLPPVVHES